MDENADPFTNAVRITVSALRKRLGEPWIIATVAGVGYRISAHRSAGPRVTNVDRASGPSVRLKLTLSYAGFVMLAGICCWPPCGCSCCGTCPGERPSSFTARTFRRPAMARSYRFRTSRSHCSGVSPRLRNRRWVATGWSNAGSSHSDYRCYAHTASGSLSHRIRLPGRNDEFHEFADAFDAMFAELEAHVAEQQRFAANASHELRTPLAITQTLLEVARNSPDGAKATNSSTAFCSSMPERSTSPKRCSCSAAPTDGPSPRNASTCP